MSAFQRGLKVFSVVITLLALAACGFQLRGSYQIPAQLAQVSLEAPARSEIASRLRDEFDRYDIQVVARGQDITHIELLEDSLDRRVLSLLISGQVAEYELIYTVPVRVHTANGDIQLQDIQVLRDYQEDPNFALAKTRELELLVNEMRSDAVHRIMLLLTQLTWE
ncbi:LPS assembly lipoprotein LptE [Aliidiomarina maris]|uniref:LPS-assembly lipoprotein LptE n=1 Tax=Aliidiomarina maris TaxID=531312 RepID=A0A327WY42_9GAMM|nr:LPS assembly lipoprotein LptE [Aliidiomarina maris]MBA3988060.1 hypothetical protein [Idiomarina sp.]MCL5050047.1 LPS assembly lipoprotein LptE [Bacillota bacterium]RAJ96818.1 LPS-assembly lipoprotein [Aliidiomarina maris]RUO24238.1 hypothetical protein CWE07_09145 [Aliidiomarina maris]